MNRVELKQRARENVRKDKFSIILITLIATALMSCAALGSFSLPVGGLFSESFLTIAPETTQTEQLAAKGDEFDLDDFFDDDGEFDADYYFGYDNGDENEGGFQNPFQNPFAYDDPDYDDYSLRDYGYDTDVNVGSAGLALVAFLLTGALTAGLLTYHRKIWNGQEGELKDLFSRFNKDFPRITKMYLLQTLYVFLWSLLFIIPGIVMALAYSQAYFLMLDDPDLSAVDALNKSKELMRGRKWELFVLYCSFIGWALLGVLTLGILYLWLDPYILQTVTGYYETVIRPAKLAAETAAAQNGFVPDEGPAPSETTSESGVSFTDVEATPAAEEPIERIRPGE